MPPKYDIRLGDLEGKSLEVKCFRCDRVSAIDPKPLIERFGPHERVVKIDKHFKCSACGNRVANTWRVRE